MVAALKECCPLVSFLRWSWNEEQIQSYAFAIAELRSERFRIFGYWASSRYLSS